MLIDTSIDNEENGSDYGSDFDEDGKVELSQLLDSIEVSIEKTVLRNAFEVRNREHYATRTANSSLSDSSRSMPSAWKSRSLSAEINNQERFSHSDIGPKTSPREGSSGRIYCDAQNPVSIAKDCRSPLERFRKSPKKPLSVTDFVSPAWCELQYAYSLAKYGRVKQTAAMKRGEALHSKLEQQDHQTVRIDVQTKEDAFGLKIWNVIQGLRSLRATGMTRELEVWGVVDGQVVNGIIDELSLARPKLDIESSITRRRSTGGKAAGTSLSSSSSTDHVTSRHDDEPQKPNEEIGFSQANERKVYLTDVKTRNSRTLPGKISMRPTELQLMFYRHLFAGMASGSVDSSLIFKRYNLDESKPFSDSLIAQLSSVDFNIHSQAGADDNVPIESETDAVIELLRHNCLIQLWKLMQNEYRKTVPRQTESIGRVLAAEFRNSSDGSILGTKTFMFDDQRIRSYITDEMRWWKGEREARGVDIEEAFKCRWCDFAETCTWRLKKVDDAILSSREKATGRVSIRDQSH